MYIREENKVSIDNRCFLTKADKERYIARLRFIYYTQVLKQCESVKQNYIQACRNITCFCTEEIEENTKKTKKTNIDSQSKILSKYIQKAFERKRSWNEPVWALLSPRDYPDAENIVIEQMKTIMQQGFRLAVGACTMKQKIEKAMLLYKNKEYAKFNANLYPTTVKWSDLQWVCLMAEFADAWVQYCKWHDEKAKLFLTECMKLMYEEKITGTEIDTKKLTSTYAYNPNKRIDNIKNYINVNFNKGMKDTCTEKIMQQLKAEPVQAENKKGEIGKGMGYEQMNRLYKKLRTLQCVPEANKDLDALGYALCTHVMCNEDEERFRTTFATYGWFEAAELIQNAAPDQGECVKECVEVSISIEEARELPAVKYGFVPLPE